MQIQPALPSGRYLKILQKGAKHSKLAGEYQIYLEALQSYQPSTKGQRIGGVIVMNTFGRPLRYLGMHLLPKAKSKFFIWMVHEVFANMQVNMWLVHDYILEPILGSGRYN